MFYIQRSEQFVQYYWKDYGWTTDKAKAKLFDSPEEARAEMKAERIQYTYTVSQV
jgi:hypothetical protein